LSGDEGRDQARTGGDTGELEAPTPEPAGVLIIGYGNPLRGDDGIGWLAAGLLAEDPRLRGARVLARHQLTPELAADLADASLVILVDVNVTADPGVVSVRGLDGSRRSSPASTHHADPGDLAALARELYGAAPAVFVVSVGAASLDLGEGLSAPVEKALPAVVEAVVELVACHAGPGQAG